MPRTLINVPQSAPRGSVIDIRTLIAHPMETGFRPDESGRLRPRDIIHTVTCTYNGEEVFRAELSPAIAANPFLAFTTVATESGELVFRWIGDDGTTHTETVRITVT